jgi:hypothetical protein
MKADDAWIEALEEGLSNVRSGQTFGQAFSQIPRLKGSPAELARWQKLAERIESGRLSAEAALLAQLQERRLRRRLHRLSARKCALPRTQSQALSVTALLVLASSQVLFPPELRPSGGEMLLACALIAAAHAGMQALCHRFARRLWDLDWLLLLARVDSGLAWGSGPASAWSAAWEEACDLKWPPALRTQLEAWILSLRGGGPRPASEPTVLRDAALRRVFGQLERLAERQARGLELRPLLRAYLDNGWEAAESRVDEEGERLAVQLLAPLFLGLVPAILVPIWAPVWRLIGHAGPG